MSGPESAEQPTPQPAGATPAGATLTGATPAGLGALREFELERFFDRFEFDLPYQMGSSDPETLSLGDLLDHAGRRLRARWSKLRLGYRTAAGDPDLRAAIAATYRGRHADDVIVTVGAAEALLLAFAAVIEPGDRVVALSPAYQSLHEVPRSMGAGLELVGVPQAAEGEWRFPLDRLLDALQPGVRLLVLNVPHNPTGVTVTPDQLRIIVSRCEALGIRVLGDEVYRGLEWAGPTPRSVTELSDTALAVGVTSKVYGLAGLRIGWLVTGDAECRGRMVSIKDYTTLCAAGPSEVLAMIAMRANAALRERTRTRCLRNMAHLEAFVDARPDLFAWRRPAATTISVARVAPQLLARHDGDPERVFAHWRETAGVVVAPGLAFGCAADQFRLGFGRADLPRALEALAAAG